MNPKDIKVKINDKLKSEISMWLLNQLQTAFDDRSEQERNWLEWHDQYEEITKKKVFPFKNCSNVFIPLTPIAVETIHAREVNTILGTKPYIQVRRKKEEMSEADAVNIERFLDEVLRTVVNGYDTLSMWIMEKDKMGDGFVKVYWKFDQTKIKKGKGFRTITEDDVAIDVIAIEDLIFPSSARAVEQALWVAHRFRMDWNVLKRKEKLGIYENIDKIKDFYRQDNDTQGEEIDFQKVKKGVEGIDERSPDILKDYELFEVYFDWDIDNDGIAERLVATYEKKSNTIIRLIHFPFNHGRRPLVQNSFMKRTNRIYSKGITEMSKQLQIAINTVFNQTIDNATIANVKCFKGLKSAKRDIGEIYPGKVFWLDSTQDLEDFTLGEVHQSNFVLHGLLRDYHERRTKVTDLNLGRPSEITRSRATATGTLALLQESGRHFDLILNNSREAMTEIAYQIIELYAQYAPNKVFTVTGKDGTLEQLRLPKIGTLREEYTFHATATSIAVNKEIEKQANMVLVQQLSGVFRQVLQLIMLTASPQTNLPDSIKKYIFDMVRSYHKMAEDIVRSFEKLDVNVYVPELPDIVKQALQSPLGAVNQEDLVAAIGGELERGGGREAALAGFGEAAGLGEV